MRVPTSLLLAVGLLVLVSASMVAASTPDEAILTLSPDRSVSLGARLFYEIQRRQLRASDDSLLDIDVTVIGAAVGLDVMPGVTLGVEAGWSEADEVESFRHGQGGLMLGAMLSVGLLEKEIQAADTLPGKRSLLLSADVSYRRLESNFGDTDFTWSEFTARPMLTYRASYLSDAMRQPYKPLNVAGGVGILFKSVDGEMGPMDLESNRDFGYALEATLGWESGWETSFSGSFLGTHDYALQLALEYRL